MLLNLLCGSTMHWGAGKVFCARHRLWTDDISPIMQLVLHSLISFSQYAALQPLLFVLEPEPSPCPRLAFVGGNRTFRYFANSPPGRFAPLNISIPGRFATSLDVSPLDDKDYS